MVLLRGVFVLSITVQHGAGPMWCCLEAYSCCLSRCRPCVVLLRGIFVLSIKVQALCGVA